MRKPIIMGNWKMQLKLSNASQLITDLRDSLFDFKGNVDIVVCPSHPHLHEVSKDLPDYIKLGGQDMYWEDEGAFTGAVSGIQLKEIGCSYVILGHSERRHIFGEKNEEVNKKIKAALKNNLIPVLCVGELLEERKQKKTREVISSQIKKGLKGIENGEAKNIIIAYEPVWAISGGDPQHKAATAEDAQEGHKIIRKLLLELYSKEFSQNTRIIYGGSMKSENASELLEKEDIDGGLIGGASLKAEDFVKVIEKTDEIKNR